MRQIYVKIENDNVTQVWDTPPPTDELEFWKEAIEIRPNINTKRTGFCGHHFDITKTPVEIIFETYNFSIDERKESLKNIANSEYIQTVRTLDEVKNIKTFEFAKTTLENKLLSIGNATTHDELDLIV